MYTVYLCIYIKGTLGTELWSLTKLQILFLDFNSFRGKVYIQILFNMLF